MKGLSLIFFALLITLAGFAQEPIDDVILIVTGDGVSKEEATNNALRSAIVQTYGEFVSANTQLLNDSLARNEIVTPTFGNIEQYKEIVAFDLPNGRKEVTVKAAVNIPKLIHYAQSKGASVEFAGALFAHNMKIMELNKKNEMDALNILLKQVKIMLPSCFDKSLIVSTPMLSGIRYDGYWYGAYKKYINYMQNRKKNKSIYRWPYKWSIKGNEDEYEITNAYLLPIEVVFTPNKNWTILNNLIINTINELSLTDSEKQLYDDSNIDTWVIQCDSIGIPYPVIRMWCDGKYYCGGNSDGRYVLRNSKGRLENWANEIKWDFLKRFLSFSLLDNLGERSYILDTNIFHNIKCWDISNLSEWDYAIDSSHFAFHYQYDTGEFHKDYIFAEGTGLFAPFARFSLDSYDEKIYLDIQVPISKEDIAKFSHFELSDL